MKKFIAINYSTNLPLGNFNAFEKKSDASKFAHNGDFDNGLVFDSIDEMKDTLDFYLKKVNEGQTHYKGLSKTLSNAVKYFER